MTANSTHLFPDPGVDLETAGAHRICNWLLGGEHHWAIDREIGAHAIRILPTIASALTANRRFMARAIRFGLTCGIRQIIDIGCGSPRDTTVHDSADSRPGCDCVYVGTDPISVAHTEIMLDRRGDPDHHAVVHADLRASQHLWSEVLDTGLIDPEQPIALLVSSTLPFMPRGDDVVAAISHYKTLLPAGSILVASHATTDGQSAERKRQLAELQNLGAQVHPSICYRSSMEFTALFSGLELTGPGVVSIPLWRPDQHGATARRRGNERIAASGLLAAVGQKR